MAQWVFRSGVVPAFAQVATVVWVAAQVCSLWVWSWPGNILILWVWPKKKKRENPMLSEHERL